MEGALIFIVVAGFYFLPTIFAVASKKKNASAIFFTNLLLGWTVIGWIIALIWANMHEEPAGEQPSPSNYAIDASKFKRPEIPTRLESKRTDYICPNCNFELVERGDGYCRHCGGEL